MNTRKRNSMGQFLPENGNSEGNNQKESFIFIIIKIIFGLMVGLIISPWIIIIFKNDFWMKSFKHIIQFYYQHFLNECSCSNLDMKINEKKPF